MNADSLRYLGVELGSTRIKAVATDASLLPVSSGSYTWKSAYENGYWTYALDEVFIGLKAALSGIEEREHIAAMGVSAMMHGYLAFDQDWNLLTPFRTWQNTTTGGAAEKLTALFHFNIPQRWSIAHLYQAILNDEAHIQKLAHITTLAGYVHHALTGVNAVGVGEASGMFPIDSATLDYDASMLARFDALGALPRPLKSYLPQVLCAGEPAGALTEAGSIKLDGLLLPGIPFAPPEGDAGTGMTATNAVAPRTGNVSAGTSIFSMVVLERPLRKVYPEIDMVCTPAGRPVAMVHCNNCTNDMNAWAALLSEAAALFGEVPDTDALFTKLYEASLPGEPDAGGVTVVNYLSGEGVTHFDRGCPLVLRTPESRFTLPNFLRASLYSTMATLRLGMDILALEGVSIDSLTGHGGLFKTPGVGQRYLAAACRAPVICLQTAGEGGPYGMALLAAYRHGKTDGETLEHWLEAKAFSHAEGVTLPPDEALCTGFSRYMERFKAALALEKAAIQQF